MKNIDKVVIQHHPKSNREMAVEISNLCDFFWESKINELQLITELQHFFTTYPELIWDEDGQVNGTFVHKLGKKRIKLVQKITHNMQLKFVI